MLNRNPALQRLLLLSSFSLSGNLFFFPLSTCHAVICLFSLSFLCTLCELPVIVFYFISVLNSFSPGSEYRTLQPSPPPPPLPLPDRIKSVWMFSCLNHIRYRLFFLFYHCASSFPHHQSHNNRKLIFTNTV